LTSQTQSKASLILVEDNEALSQELENYLTEEGFDVRCADGGEALNQALLERPANLLILDLNMAEEDGISIAKRIRKSLPAVGILMLTARVMSADKLAGYESGADIYMTKPARPAELVAAIRNLLKRITPELVMSKWILDTKSLNIHFQKTTAIQLTSIEANLLKILALNNECVQTRTIQSLLQEEYLDSAKFKLRLEVWISRLRTKLSPHAGEINPIKSVRGKGYQLCVDLEIL
jgi:DNA-binding response OmpR family regulator